MRDSAFPCVAVRYSALMAAIKGPGARTPDVGRVGGREDPALVALAGELLAAGIAKTPAEARVMAKALLGALGRAGYPAPPGGGGADQLRAFQRANGLPESGKLDAATREKLADLGILPRGTGASSGEGAKGAGQTTGPGQAGAGQARGVDELTLGTPRFDMAPSLGPKGFGDVPGARPPGPPSAAAAPGERVHVVEHEQARARAEHMKDNASPSLARFLEGLASLGFLGGGKGKQRLERALVAFQKANHLLVTGKLDAATVRTLIEKGALPPDTQVPSERARASADPANPQTANASTSAASSASTNAASTTLPLPTSNPTGNTTDLEVDEEPNPDDRNAPAGDDDPEDPTRGHATLDDGSEDPEGYYEMPSLAQQLQEALETITRDDDERGQTTYSWDVTLYRPGIYGRRQPAEPLWHLVVERAGAFDPVWQEARRALVERMSAVEPDARPPTEDDFMLALRRARVRAPSPS